MKRIAGRAGLVLGAAAAVAALAVGVGAGSSWLGASNMDDEIGSISTETTWSSGIPSNVPLAPDPGPNVNSFSYSIQRQVPKHSSSTETVGCPNGFYVRPGSGDVWGDNTAEPVIKTFVGLSTMLQTQTPQLQYQYSGTPANEDLYQALEEGYYNPSLTGTHHFTMTFWCDRLATVNVIPPTMKGTSAPGSQTSSAAASGSTPTLGANNGFEATLQNAGTGMYLGGGASGSTAQMSSAAATMFAAGDQEGDLTDYYNTIGYGLWSQGGSSMVGPNLGFSGNTATWYGTDYGIANGGLLLPVTGNPGGGATMLVQAISIAVPDKGNVDSGTVGSGGMCLTAPAGGGTATLAACDATNPNQYWNFNKP